MKNETRYTPGPWACHSGSVYTDGGPVATPIARMDREAGNGTSPTERDANAHLIAAAPCMYQLLEEVRDGAIPAGSLWVDYIDAALAKARGEEVQP